MGTYFDNLGLAISYVDESDNLPNEAFWCMTGVIGAYNFCSKSVADYIIAKIRKFPKEPWYTMDKLVWNMINCLH